MTSSFLLGLRFQRISHRPPMNNGVSNETGQERRSSQWRHEDEEDDDESFDAFSTEDLSIRNEPS
jgi:hypothetical protein